MSARGKPGPRYRHCRGAGTRRRAPLQAAFFTSAQGDRVCATVIAVGAAARRRAPLRAAFFCVRAGGTGFAQPSLPGRRRAPPCAASGGVFLRPRWGPGPRYRHCRRRRCAPPCAASRGVFLRPRGGTGSALPSLPARAAVRRFRRRFFASARGNRVRATVIAVGAAARRINFKKCVNALREEPDLRGGYHHSAFFARSFFHLYKFGLSTNNIFENTADRKRSLKNIFDLEETE